MVSFMFKVIVGGVAMYGVSKILEKTQILEKIIATSVTGVDQVLTKVNEAYEKEQNKQHMNGSNR